MYMHPNINISPSHKAGEWFGKGYSMTLAANRNQEPALRLQGPEPENSTCKPELIAQRNYIR